MPNDIFWVRVLCCEFDDPRWAAIDQMPEGDCIGLCYIKMMMLAGRSNADGMLLLHDKMPYDLLTLAAVLRRPAPIVQLVLTTLEKFQLIELIDGIISIIDWQKTQATTELNKIAERRAKDAERKRRKRDAQRQLLIAKESAAPSADTSADSLRMSGTIELDLESEIDTTHDVVIASLPSEHNNRDMMMLIPVIEHSQRLEEAVCKTLREKGQDYVRSNIHYCMMTHDPGKGTLGGYIHASMSEDYAKNERVKAKAAEISREIAAENRVRQLEHAKIRYHQECATNDKRMKTAMSVFQKLPESQRSLVEKKASDITGAESGVAYEWALVDVIEQIKMEQGQFPS